jgi:hypothetical protein
MYADLTAYDAPRASGNTPPFTRYKQVLPVAVPTSLTAVVTQLVGCTSAITGGTAGTLVSGCGVYINTLVISCPTSSAGTIIVQDFQSTPILLVPTIANTANTVYSLTFPWYWAPGGFKIQQATEWKVRAKSFRKKRKRRGEKERRKKRNILFSVEVVK